MTPVHRIVLTCRDSFPVFTTMTDHEKSALELEKLRWEVATLRQNARWERLAGRVLSFIGPSLVFLGLLVGGCQYRETKEREFKRAFWEQQLDVYDSVARSAARLVAPGDTAGREAEYQKFMTLYNGPLLMVADSVTAYKVRDFYSELINYRSNPGHHREAAEAARAMSAAFRDQLRFTWEVPLNQLPPSTF